MVGSFADHVRGAGRSAVHRTCLFGRSRVLVLAIGVPAGLIMALPAQVLRPESARERHGRLLHLLFSSRWPSCPAQRGLVRDLSGSPAAPALFAAAMVLLCALALALFHAATPLPNERD